MRTRCNVTVQSSGLQWLGYIIEEPIVMDGEQPGELVQIHPGPSLWVIIGRHWCGPHEITDPRFVVTLV